MKLAFITAFMVTMLDEISQFLYTIKRDRQLSASGEQPLGVSTYYMMAGYTAICTVIFAVVQLFLPASGSLAIWKYLVLTAVMYVAFKLVATFIQTLFVFFAIRKKESYYKKLSKENRDNGINK